MQQTHHELLRGNERFIMKSSIFSSRHWMPAFTLLLVACVMGAFGAPNAGAVSGNIGSASIEIDTGSAGANLYPSSASVSDWVKDSLPNTDPASLVNSVATGIIPGTTGAVGGKGHWNGVRI